MDQVVQRNASNAEESASASQEMNAQAAQMNGFVKDLVAIVGASDGGTHGKGRSIAGKTGTRQTIRNPFNALATNKKKMEAHVQKGSGKNPNPFKDVEEAEPEPLDPAIF